MTEPTITVEEQIAWVVGACDVASGYSSSEAAYDEIGVRKAKAAILATLRRVALLEKVAEAARKWIAENGREAGMDDLEAALDAARKQEEGAPQCRKCGRFATERDDLVLNDGVCDKCGEKP
jgi:hypothetical protein